MEPHIKKVKKETKQKVVSTFFNILNAVFVIIVLVLGFISIFNKPLMIEIIEWFEVLIQWVWNWNYLIAFSSSIIEAFPVLWVVVPGQNIMLLVAIFFAKLSWGKLILIYVLASVWAVIWNYIWYYLGRKFGDDFFKKYWVRFGVWVTEVKYLKKWIHKWWPIGITLWKFHNVTRAFLPFIAGSMWMKEKSFIFYNVVGSILRAVTIVTIGVVFGKYYEVILTYFGRIFIAVILWTLGFFYLFRRDALNEYIKEKSQELDNL